jgi:hypothetical protein
MHPMSRGEAISAVIADNPPDPCTSTTKDCYDSDDCYDNTKCNDVEVVHVDHSTNDDKDDNESAPVPMAEQVTKNTRLDISASLFASMSEYEKQYYIDTFVAKHNDSITTIHLSGQRLHTVLTTDQLITLIESIRHLRSITEFFCFYGDLDVLTSDLLAKSLPPNLHTLILWHFPSLSNKFAASLRQQSLLQRVTFNFTCTKKQQLPWGCLDVCIMACACMEQLQVLQIRCIPKTIDYQLNASSLMLQQESIITPEAMVLLLNSPTITQLYLENCGLIDDHMDEVYNELPKNRTLTMLDLKSNIFTDDCLYTTGRLLPIAPPQLHYLDISGVPISDNAGNTVAAGMMKNYTLQSLEIEGTLLRYQDEFNIPIGHTNTAWMQQITYQLRLNRAYQMAYEASLNNNRNVVYGNPNNNNRKKVATFVEKQNVVANNVAAFVVAVSSVSDNESCLYHFLRSYPDHNNRLIVPLPHVEPN